MTATERGRGDNPRWLAALATAAPVALAAVFVLWASEPDPRRSPPARPPGLTGPAHPIDPNWHTSVARAR
ncbi:hypothetical protein GobsT_23610 [Gemmata obscuriglobus]|uniref:Uncharacterized protein n=1 Tax=Gemmata obscuriglobus TaxID=114 RepID=A0A2Z3GZY9_9BACT|nr:hypothetical protein [Gemmata obscuriglobus]AWM39333.1 hypothetical protein C1280_21630 [Gemmata obscuriglobus]QEG27602.1 hypothetical protein GobsT_23610 [Gemmata obscuriglobus]VTS04727.1 unnamed protein product [Gemmata obscuriglobus UQM 2246]